MENYILTSYHMEDGKQEGYKVLGRYSSEREAKAEMAVCSMATKLVVERLKGYELVSCKIHENSTTLSLNRHGKNRVVVWEICKH